MKNEVINISGVECYEKDGTAYLKLDTVARGLGFTRIAESGNEVVRWERVEKYLNDLGVPTCGHDDFIPENIFYRLAISLCRLEINFVPHKICGRCAYNKTSDRGKRIPAINALKTKGIKCWEEPFFCWQNKI